MLKGEGGWEARSGEAWMEASTSLDEGAGVHA